MQRYETIFILDSLLAPEEIDKLINRVKEIVESNGGKTLTVDKWGKRRLAYEIQKKQYGFYVAIEFESEGPIPNSLEHEYNFNDKILRYLTYRYTKNKMIAREKELETKKNLSVTADIPEVIPAAKVEAKKVEKTEEEKPAEPEVAKPEPAEPETEAPKPEIAESEVSETTESEDQEPDKKEAENA